MKHLVFIEIDTDTTSRSNPTQFSTVLAAEIISRQTDSIKAAAISHVVKTNAFLIVFPALVYECLSARPHIPRGSLR